MAVVIPELPAAHAAPSWRVRFLDLAVRDPQLKAELLATVDRVLTHGRLVLGPEVEQFEAEVATIAHKHYAVGVNSGTDALYLALRSLGIGPGDEVITTALSWIATANAITLCGARPVFVDIRSDLNIDPDRVKEAVTPRSKAIVPVHFTGKMCDMSALTAIAEQHGLAMVEDAAQAFSGRNKDGVAGSFGVVSSFSMNPMKVFGAYGEAGAVVTSDPTLRDRLDSLRYGGTINKEDCHTPSVNGRLDTLQAAMLLVNLRYLEERIARRRANAAFYTEALSSVVRCPVEADQDYHVYYTYTIVAEQRDELKAFLEGRGIETKIQHPILMPYHTAYRHMPKPEIPNAERLVDRILCIPAHEKLDQEQLDFVAASVREFYEAGR